MNRSRTGKNKYNRRIRKSQRIWIFLSLVAAGILVAGIGFGIAVNTGSPNKTLADNQENNGKNITGDKETAVIKEEAQESLQPEIHIGSVDVTGLSYEEIKEKLDREWKWNLSVTDGEESILVENLIHPQLEQILRQIADDDTIHSRQYELDYNQIEYQVKSAVQAIADKWNKKPLNSQLQSFNKETKAFLYTKEEYGRMLNQEYLEQKLNDAIRQGTFQAEIKAEFTSVAPSRTQSMAKEKYQVIGTFKTKTTDNKNRNENIRLAVEAIDGMVLKPGEEFSFNTATGNRTTEKGYRPAGAYKNGVLIEEPGGGVCQVSTTLYNAVIKSGYQATERNFHSFAPSYIEKGQDAMVSFDGYDGPDLKFVNTQNTTVAIRAAFQNQELKISIVGLPVLDDGEMVTMQSEKVRDVEPQPPVYEENPNLLFGQEKLVEQAQPGSVWKTYRIVTKGGQEVERQLLHTSTYKAKPALIQRNTTVPNQDNDSRQDQDPEEIQTNENQLNPETEDGNPAKESEAGKGHPQQIPQPDMTTGQPQTLPQPDAATGQPQMLPQPDMAAGQPQTLPQLDAASI